MAKENPLSQLTKQGQSVWYDNISRDLIKSGELKRLIDEFSVRGLTSNPTIFDGAIKTGATYDSQINALKGKGLSTDQLFEELAVEDIGQAADLLLPIHKESNGDDGFVSIEVSPLLASNTEGTITEAVRLYDRLSRPNIMIKVPGTKEGIPAVRNLLERGINVNITLLFSVANYIEVATTYCDALQARAQKGLPIDRIRSVASFFVSRVDTLIDQQLEGIAKQCTGSDGAKAEKALSYRGKFGVANSREVYQRFNEIFHGARFAALKQKGAVPQRPLWASTSTKNPAYRDVFYCEDLIGSETVNTMPDATLRAFADHGHVARTIEDNLPQALGLRAQLEAVGINVSAALIQLQEEGVKKFADSFKALNDTLQKKLTA